MDHTKKKLPLLLLTCILLLSACGSKDRVDLPPEPEDGVLIYAALNPVDTKLERSVEKFNEEHADVQIQVRDYSDEDGPQRLLVELAAGRVPDIMEMQRIAFQDYNDAKNVEAMYFGSPLDADMSDFYWMPYRQMAQKGYLEDLWPYIENDPDLGREGVLEAPLKAAEVDGGLYMLFGDVSVNTLIGSRDMFGDRWGWTMEEMKEAFAAMPPGATVLQFDATQYKVFRTLMSPMLDQYVDWENGQCSFDCENFREALQFVNGFPDEFQHTTAEELNRESLDRLRRGKQMLWAYPLYNVMDIQLISALIANGGQVSFVGYPTADGSIGSSFIPKRNLVMSSVCQDKEAAWEFLRQMILPKYDQDMIREGNGPLCIPINREDHDNVKRVAQSDRFVPKGRGFGKRPDNVRVEYHKVTDEEWERYETLVNSITRAGMYDTNIYNIVWEAAGAYFAGDKTLDETVALIQNRVTLYINEQR